VEGENSPILTGGEHSIEERRRIGKNALNGSLRYKSSFGRLKGKMEGTFLLIPDREGEKNKKTKQKVNVRPQPRPHRQSRRNMCGKAKRSQMGSFEAHARKNLCTAYPLSVIRVIDQPGEKKGERLRRGDLSPKTSSKGKGQLTPWQNRVVPVE